jgi:hypothetical protein
MNQISPSRPAARGRHGPLVGLTMAILLTAMAVVWPSSVVAAEPTRQIGMGVAVPNSRSLQGFDDFTASVGGHAPAIWTLWVNWAPGDSLECAGAPACSFPESTLLDGLLAQGTVPMINWQPYNDDQTEADAHFTYRRIVAGKFDAYIKSFARDAKTWGHTVILRLAHEMNGPWFPWGIGRFDNTATNFKQAWRHVYRLVHDVVGATNVKFLWTPNAPCKRCVDYSKIYPGDAYVQYVGFSQFNWSTKVSPWRSMERLYKSPLAALHTVAPHKRIIIAETGSSPTGGSKANWIKDGYAWVYNHQPRVLAIVYFDVRVLKHPDWRLTSPSSALAAYAAVAGRFKYQRRL